MTFLPKLDPEQLITLMPRATVLMGVPTFYTRLLASPRLDREAVRNMRLFVSGSAPLLAETHRDFFERTGHAILERYGMTETNMNTSNPYDGERRPGTVGFALPGSEVRITDRDSGKVLAAGETGLVEVRGPNVFKGLLAHAGEDRRRIPRGWLLHYRRSGGDRYRRLSVDRRTRQGSGDLRWLQRLSQGDRAVDRRAAGGGRVGGDIGVNHPDLGEGVTAAVVLKPGAALDEAQVLAHSATRWRATSSPNGCSSSTACRAT